MRWTPGGESQDVEDRRDESGGGGGFQFGGMHIGIGGAILLLILSFVFKTNFFALLSGGGSVSPGPAAATKHNPARDAAEKPLVQFVSFVLDDTQKTWTELLPQQGGSRIATRNWCFSGIPSNRDAAGRKPRRACFIVPATRGFTSIWVSLTN